ncbi:histidinol dehydrogenase [Oleiphilus messinensis]|uniref:Histidinol dehydrogenase n=1 Tax=Oleiphilus messinensis TaxID=141451 RepID=A0A1Y0I6W8_9GAMM|nr:histidinol dehydrogenase [Oleiphilus messinensis]ARU55980.1 histidinol dehydrogenase [Oleiphilus messinensis]
MSEKVDITILDSTEESFDERLSELLAWDEVSDKSVQETVTGILADVKSRGDDAVMAYTEKFDRVSVTSASQLELDRDSLQGALESLEQSVKEALIIAADRIRSYHEKQVQESWQYKDDQGTVLGQKVTPMDRVGIYVPGGKAAYPSSVLMNAIPAKVAGVAEVIMVVPTPGGQVNQMVLAAAALSGVDRVFTIGGAQAVAALAYGTDTVPAVDKIVGPGNIYVATAKREVFGTVGIDMIAGPSEILVLCDGKTNPDWIAMDLFSQAEHDEDAQSILVSPDEQFIEAVKESIERLLPTMERAEIIRKSIVNRAALIKTPDMKSAVAISNRIAPEHLELSVDEPEKLLPEIRHAGAIFMGRYTAEALGDYCAGPNHVLPTSGTARFSSPLGVYDFQKRSSIINFSDVGASEMGKIASILARGEGLTAHALSAEYRVKQDG